MPQNKAKTTKQVLIAAKWILNNIGWRQGSFEKYDAVSSSPVAFCLVGAIQVVNADGVVRGSTKRLLTSMLGNGLYHLPSWNDTAYRTKEEVLALLDKAIAKA
jgi:hypothetical protein